MLFYIKNKTTYDHAAYVVLEQKNSALQILCFHHFCKAELLYTIDAVLTPSDPLKPNLITNLSVEITDPELANFFTISTTITNASVPSTPEPDPNADPAAPPGTVPSDPSSCSVTITGNVPLDIFDQYSVEHIEQGFSNKNQQTVVDLLADIPDKREVYKINVDGRSTISSFLKISLTSNYKPAGTEMFVTETNTYEMKHRQTYDMVHNCTTTYFGDRYK